MWLTRLFTRRKPVSVPLHLYNTLGREKQRFDLPPGVKAVRMYNCGPTVYDTQHIGNLSMFVFADILRRTLEFNNFAVKQVINITDVGHLTSDADAGEDRMTKGLKREKMKITLENMRTLAERYTDIFLQDLVKLNINTKRILFPRASDHISAQIAMVHTLEEKGYAYIAQDGVYFDTARFQSYGELGGIKAMDTVRARISSAAEKRSPSDFALWKFDKKLGWQSPWGKGFPGWHIECSAMIRATLGQQIDIHTGGIEHISVHHNNEIAQSEAVTGRRPLSRFWMHRAHVQLEGVKLAKSVGNVVYLSGIIERGFHPLALRYLFLGAHYRTPSNFTWEALEAAQTALLRLRRFVSEGENGGTAPPEYLTGMHERINDDLDTPGALASLWDMVKDDSLSPADRRAGVLSIDSVLGLGLDLSDSAADKSIEDIFGRKLSDDEIPEDVQSLILERDAARLAKNWSRADSIRDELKVKGYELKDASEKTIVYKK